MLNLASTINGKITPGCAHIYDFNEIQFQKKLLYNLHAVEKSLLDKVVGKAAECRDGMDY